MAQMWTKLAADRERLRHLNAQGAYSDNRYKNPSRALRPMPLSAPDAKALMKVRTFIPGRKIDDVPYRCEKCGGEVVRSIPRAW
jgi:hypothetical protein